MSVTERASLLVINDEVEVVCSGRHDDNDSCRQNLDNIPFLGGMCVFLDSQVGQDALFCGRDVRFFFWCGLIEKISLFLSMDLTLSLRCEEKF